MRSENRTDSLLLLFLSNSILMDDDNPKSKGRSVTIVMVWVFVQFQVFMWFFMTDFHWTTEKVGERRGI